MQKLSPIKLYLTLFALCGGAACSQSSAANEGSGVGQQQQSLPSSRQQPSVAPSATPLIVWSTEPVVVPTPQTDSEKQIFKEIDTAVSKRDYERLTKLLASKPNLNVSSNGSNTILIGVLFDDLKAAEMLLAAGADPNQPSEVIGCDRAERCLKPPTYIIHKDKFVSSNDNNYKALRLLLKYGANPNAESLLAQATGRGETEVVKLLLEYKADVNYHNDVDGDGSTPIFFADDLAIAKILVKNGANIDYVNKNGETALTIAASDNSLEKVRFLLKNGANINALNAHNETAIQIAQTKGNKLIISELKKAATKN